MVCKFPPSIRLRQAGEAVVRLFRQPQEGPQAHAVRPGGEPDRHLAPAAAHQIEQVVCGAAAALFDVWNAADLPDGYFHGL